MTEETLPPDPFQNNPLLLVSEIYLRLLEDEVIDYFDLFPGMSYDHVVEFAGIYVEQVMEEEPSLVQASVEKDEFAAFVIHGLAIGALFTRGPEYLSELDAD